MSVTEDPQHHYEFATSQPLPLSDMRAWLRACLHGQCDDILNDAALLVTELVSNAYEHAGGVLNLRVFFPKDRDTMRIEVDDADDAETADRVPQQRDPSTSFYRKYRGRGLLLVDTLSTDWGVFTGAHQKTVWAEMRLG